MQALGTDFKGKFGATSELGAKTFSTGTYPTEIFANLKSKFSQRNPIQRRNRFNLWKRD